MHRDFELYREWFFTIRGYFHDLYNAEGGKVKGAYPAAYDGVRQITYMVQEDRVAKKTAAAKRVSFLINLAQLYLFNLLCHFLLL